MSVPTFTIGLLWHSMSSDNLGVGALTMSNLAILEAIADEMDTEVPISMACTASALCWGPKRWFIWPAHR